MSRILIHAKITPYGEYDIFNSTDYSLFCDVVKKDFGGSCPNIGNRLWFQGIISVISCEENELTYYSSDMTADYINNSFDLIVAPMANIFNPCYKQLIKRLADTFSRIKIPIYVIACGAQAESYDDLNALCEEIGEESTAFIKSIYATGGEFALRGYFTKEFFLRLGFNDAAVTGCPSLFQLGRSTQLTLDKKASKNDFKPIINGNFNQYADLLKKYPGSVFLDQDKYFAPLYDKAFFSDNVSKDVFSLVRQLGLPLASAISEGKITFVADMSEWSGYLKHEGFNFSFGGRIHGNIMSLLSGVPSVVLAHDSRTREMAEFFEIPSVAKIPDDLYTLYLDADFSAFNKSFPERFDAYEKFLVSHGIVKRINTDNIFFKKEYKGEHISALNSEKLDTAKQYIQKNRLILSGLDSAFKLYRKIRNV